MILSAVITFVIVVIGLQIGLLLYLSLRKQKRNKYEMELNQLYESLLDSFTSYMAGLDKQLFISEIEQLDDRAVLVQKLLNSYVAVVKNSTVSLEVLELSETYLKNTYTAVLKKKIGRTVSIRFTTSKISACILCLRCFGNDFLQLKSWIQKHSSLFGHSLPSTKHGCLNF